MHDSIPLWPVKAPYSAQSPDQMQPSITAYRVNSLGAVVICPGGAYRMKAPHEGGPIAEMLNRAGISAFVLDYRVKPCHYLAPLSDASRAIRLVRSMGYEKVGILGFSAGGHLCVSAATIYDTGKADDPDPVQRLSSRPDVFIPCYSVMSMFRFTHSESRVNLLGEHADDVRYMRMFSADQHITDDTPPAFIWHTADDADVPVENSLLLAKALSDKDIPFELHIFPHGEHGLGLAQDLEDVAQWAPLCAGFLQRQGFAAKKERI